jgi:uncharacterized membrane protein YsdA (DUF1294 family)
MLNTDSFRLIHLGFAMLLPSLGLLKLTLTGGQAWVYMASLSMVASAITCFLYAYDKRQAKRQAHRIAETTFHGLSLLGGWPGAALGQILFHHKTKKMPYRAIFLGIVLSHQFFWFSYLLLR